MGATDFDAIGKADQVGDRASQLDRIEAEVARIHERLDAAEPLLAFARRWVERAHFWKTGRKLGD